MHARAVLQNPFRTPPGSSTIQPNRDEKNRAAEERVHTGRFFAQGLLRKEAGVRRCRCTRSTNKSVNKSERFFACTANLSTGVTFFLFFSSMWGHPLS
jgi:hypothetical protein